MMKFFKRIFLHLALSRRQRNIIWNALQYSDYKYRTHQKVGRAVEVARVISETEAIFGVTKRRYTAKEVEQMLIAVGRETRRRMASKVHEAYHSGKQQGIREVVSNIKHGRGMVIGEVVTVEEPAAENKSAEAPAATAPAAPAETAEKEQN